MPVRTSTAEWNGNLKEGQGTMALGDGAYEGPYSFLSRFKDGQGTNPEELIGAAHAGCYSMAFSNMLDEAGHTPERVLTTAHVTLSMDEGPVISAIRLVVEAEVAGIEEEAFLQIAEKAKDGCPVSQVLNAEITLEATLKSGATAR